MVEKLQINQHLVSYTSVQNRISFNIQWVVYEALNGLAPKYICDLLSVYNPVFKLYLYLNPAG